MDKATALAVVRSFRTALERSGIGIRNLVLFGSYASNTYSEGSDIDVVVVSDSFKGLNNWQRIELMSDALYEVFQPIEARALTVEEWDTGESLTDLYVKSGVSISL